MMFVNTFLSIPKTNRAKQKPKSKQKPRLKPDSFKTRKHLQNETEYDEELAESSKFSNEYELYNEEIQSKS